MSNIYYTNKEDNVWIKGDILKTLMFWNTFDFLVIRSFKTVFQTQGTSM